MSNTNDMKKPRMKPMTSETPRSSRRRPLRGTDSRRHHRMAQVVDHPFKGGGIERDRLQVLGALVAHVHVARGAGGGAGAEGAAGLVLPVRSLVEVVAE